VDHPGQELRIVLSDGISPKQFPILLLVHQYNKCMLNVQNRSILEFVSFTPYPAPSVTNALPGRPFRFSIGSTSSTAMMFGALSE
jgi:hypothetical protein